MKMNKGGSFEKPPQGIHQAVCYGVVDLGTQTTTFNGKEKTQPKLVVLFEFAKLRLDDGRPQVQSQMYTASLNDKSNLYKHLKSWKGRAMTAEEKENFESSMIIGKNCQLQIIHSEDGKYANIENILPLSEGMVAVQAENPTIDYEITPGYIPEGMYDWLADKIRASEEWAEAPDGVGGEVPAEAPDEQSDIEPF
jgi:hypothetical protein